MQSIDLAHPAYLFIGDSNHLIETTITVLQKQKCLEKSGCAICIQCRKVTQQQHESIVWIEPEKQYTLEDIKIIFSTIVFTLSEQQHFFFILKKAEQLSSACANALLKSLEEPPAGYHFILLANRTDGILPTIRSRCIIHHVSGTDTSAESSLFPFFTTSAFQDPQAFLKELENTNPTEWETLALLNQLMKYWAESYKKNISSNNSNNATHALGIIEHLKKALVQPPMPGSSKLFLKNLFLQIKEIN